MCNLDADESEPYSLTNLCQQICYQVRANVFMQNQIYCHQELSLESTVM